MLEEANVTVKVNADVTVDTTRNYRQNNCQC